MIIHIESELISKINEMNSDEISDFNIFIDKIWLAIEEGKHIISINKSDLLKLQKSNLLSDNNKKRLLIFDKIKGKNYQSLNNLIKQINPTDIIRITYDIFEKKSEENIRNIYIPYTEFLDSKSMQKTTIVSENIQNDGSIYQELFPEIYKRYDNLPFKFDLDKDMGGGNTIHNVLEGRCTEKDVKFHLFIVDGDRISPLKPGIGTTAKTIKKSYKQCKSNSIYKFKLYILNVRELENLIPLLFIKEHCGEEFYNKYIKIIETKPEIIKYFDIKKGIRKCYNNDKKYNSVYDCSIEECNDDNKKIYCEFLKKSNLDFFDEGKCNKLLKNFYDKYESNLDELESIILNNCEFEEIKENWIEIGRLIYSWGVCLEKLKII
jgi:hypothetical protein